MKRTGKKYDDALDGRPPPLNDTVRRSMQTMPTKDTSPELSLRRNLHRRGMRYRLHDATLPGRPDIVFRRPRIAVFVDGCFWHHCPWHCVLPKNNRMWWKKKLLGNRDRDRRKDEALAARGWLAIHVWEHENMATAAVSIATLVGRGPASRRPATAVR